jgi:hypothetical protein
VITILGMTGVDDKGNIASILAHAHKGGQVRVLATGIGHNKQPFTINT